MHYCRDFHNIVLARVYVFIDNVNALIHFGLLYGIEHLSHVGGTIFKGVVSIDYLGHNKWNKQRLKMGPEVPLVIFHLSGILAGDY